jgi:PAS domain S-box-containing protein
MIAAHSGQRVVYAAIASAVGLGACLATGTAFGLLAPIAALFISEHTLRPVTAMLAIAFAGAVLATSVDIGGSRDLALWWTAFFAVSLSIGALVAPEMVGATLNRLARWLVPAAGLCTEEDGLANGPSSLDSVHPDDRSSVSQVAARAFNSGTPQIVGVRRRQADGSYQWTEFRAEPDYSVSVAVDPMVSTPGEPWTLAGSLGETVEAVRAAQVIERLHGAAFAFDATGRFTYATPIGQTSNGMTLEDLNRPLGGGAFIDGGDLGWKLGVHPDDYEGVAARLRECLRSGEDFNYEYRILRTTGQYAWHRFAIRPARDNDGRISGWYGTGFDIDDYKNTEAALREQGRLLKQFVDAVPAMIWSTTPEGTPAYVNKRFTDVIGCGIEDITAPDGSLTLSVVVHPDYRHAAKQTLTRSMETGTPYLMQYLQHRADGSYRWTETRAEPLRDETGSILQWYGVCVDIHDMVTAEAALRESERSLRQLVETLPAMIDCALPDGEPIYRSRRLSDFLGYDLEALDEEGGSRLIGTLDAGVHPDDLAGVKERYAHSLVTGDPYARRHRLRRFDGEYRWVETRAAAMSAADGSIVQWNVICLDIDAEVRTQEELRLAREELARASQAASLAELSASIAHEVNQPLAAIVANSHACNRWLSAEPPNVDRAKTTAERIIRDANSAADVVSRIRALFRQSVERRTCTPIASLIAEACRLMADEAMRRRIRLEVDVESDLPRVALDHVQIQQVLVNLIRNGMEAMDSATGERVLELRVSGLGDAVRVEVSDRGSGIAFPERIFDPFYTTKPEGMGMGLAICRSIVESHGGRLWVEKNEPQGTRFIFTLPIETKALP